MSDHIFIKCKDKLYNLKYVKEITYGNDYYEIKIANTDSGATQHGYKNKDQLIMCHKDHFKLCDLSEILNLVNEKK